MLVTTIGVSKSCWARVANPQIGPGDQLGLELISRTEINLPGTYGFFGRWTLLLAFPPFPASHQNFQEFPSPKGAILSESISFLGSLMIQGSLQAKHNCDISDFEIPSHTDLKF